jgi:hypothetical protein
MAGQGDRRRPKARLARLAVDRVRQRASARRAERPTEPRLVADDRRRQRLQHVDGRRRAIRRHAEQSSTAPILRQQ